MTPTLNRGEARAELAGIRRLLWLKSGLIGTDGRALQEATGNPDTTEFYPNQEAAILAFHRLNADEKCRQIGHSFALSIDSLARAALEPNTTAAHISTDQWESESKQNYVLRTLDALPHSHRCEIQLKSEARHRLELETKKGVATINFLAQRDPRGMERGGIYLHEMAHMPKLGEILKGAVAATLHGGYIKGCSTHEGAQSTFNHVMRNHADEETGEQPYRNWKTNSWPWWMCPAFCIDTATAAIQAPQMETDERVAMFGTPALQDMRLSSSLEEFREECECEVVDEKYSYFPEDLINACVGPNLVFDKIEITGAQVGAVRLVKQKIDWLASQITDGTLRGEWGWGYDVGRHRNPDVLTIGHEVSRDKGTLQLNLAISMENIEFDSKREVITHMMRNLPILKGAQDATGMGMELGEWARKEFGTRAFEVTFNNAVKSRLTNDLKIRMERQSEFGGRRLVIPQWGKLKRQFNSIRKKVLPSGAPTYDSDADGDNHADLYWSVALLNSCYEQPVLNQGFVPPTGKRPSGTFSRGGIWTPGR